MTVDAGPGRRGTHRWRYVIALAAAGALLAGLYVRSLWRDSQNVRISEAPPVQAVAPVWQPHASRLGIRGQITYESIRVAAEQATTEPYHGRARGTQCGRFLGVKACVGWRAVYTIQRAGPISVSRNGRRIRAIVPVRFHGDAGFSGGLAKRLNLDRKKFDGALRAIADIQVDLNASWCPVVSARIRHSWLRSPRVDIAGDMWIDVKAHVDGPLRANLRKLEQQIRRAVPCAKFRAEIARQWRPYSLPIRNGKAGNLFLNLVPSAMAFSGLKAEDDRLSLALRLDMRTEIGTRAIGTDPLPLPRLKRLRYRRGRIVVELPVRAPYARLQEAATKALAGKEFRVDMPVGAVRVTPRKVTVHPSGDRIVIGVEFDGSLPGRLFDISGTIYFSGRPLVAKGGRIVMLEDIRVARILDDASWTTLSAVFEGEIIRTLAARARIDLTGQADKAARLITDTLEDPEKVGGLRIALDPPTIQLVTLFPDEHELVAVLRAETAADAVIPATLFAIH